MKRLIIPSEHCMSVKQASMHLYHAIIKNEYPLTEDEIVTVINTLLCDQFIKGQKNVLRDIIKICDENDYPEYIEREIYEYLEGACVD